MKRKGEISDIRADIDDMIAVRERDMTKQIFLDQRVGPPAQAADKQARALPAAEVPHLPASRAVVDLVEPGLVVVPEDWGGALRKHPRKAVGEACEAGLPARR